jgi:hypothetical protein
MAEFALWFPPREAGRRLAALGLRVGLHVVLAGLPANTRLARSSLGDHPRSG